MTSRNVSSAGSVRAPGDSATASKDKAPKARPAAVIPPELADVALIDVNSCAAAAARATSSWLELVSEGKAPQPVIRGPRCTRWRLADVRAWLIEQAQAGTPAATVDAMRERNARSMAKAREAKQAAAAKRVAADQAAAERLGAEAAQ